MEPRSPELNRDQEQFGREQSVLEPANQHVRRFPKREGDAHSIERGRIAPALAVRPVAKRGYNESHSRGGLSKARPTE